MFQILCEFINENKNNLFGNNEMFSTSLIKFPDNDSYNPNQFTSLYEDDILNNVSQIPSNCLIQSENKKSITPKGTKTTTSKTSEPKLYSLYDISEIFNKKSN